MSIIVVTRSHFDPSVEREVLALARQSKPIAEAQPGFQSMTVHINHDRTQLMTYWVWARREDHEACMESDDWNAFMPKWQALMDAGNLKFDLETYEILDV